MSVHPTDDVRIQQIKELLPPIAVLEKFPATEAAEQTVVNARQAIHRVLNDDDDRLIVVVGPCSIHDPDAARDYARKTQATS